MIFVYAGMGLGHETRRMKKMENAKFSFDSNGHFNVVSPSGKSMQAHADSPRAEKARKDPQAAANAMVEADSCLWLARNGGGVAVKPFGVA